MKNKEKKHYIKELKEWKKEKILKETENSLKENNKLRLILTNML